MRNAQQELNLHLNTLQSELERLMTRIERLLVAEPDETGERRMPWKTPGLPAQVTVTLLEGYRDHGFDAHIEDLHGHMTLVLRPNREAVPLPITSG